MRLIEFLKTIAIVIFIPLTLAQDSGQIPSVEPPRILGIRFNRSNEGQGIMWATLHILHPHEDGLQVLQVSDGKTNKLENIIHTKPGKTIEFDIKLGGVSNVFTSRCFNHRTGAKSDWGNSVVAIP